METGPVIASEPVFSAVSSVQRHVPLIPNGSGAQTKPAEFSGKLTAEKLAAIEDEELLDKMVRHARAIILNDLSYYFDKSVFWFRRVESLCIDTKPCHSSALCVCRFVA